MGVLVSAEILWYVTIDLSYYYNYIFLTTLLADVDWILLFDTRLSSFPKRHRCSAFIHPNADEDRPANASGDWCFDCSWSDLPRGRHIAVCIKILHPEKGLHRRLVDLDGMGMESTDFTGNENC